MTQFLNLSCPHCLGALKVDMEELNAKMKRGEHLDDYFKPRFWAGVVSGHAADNADTVSVLSRILNSLNRIEEKGELIMSEVEQLMGYVKAIDSETNRIASDIEALHNQAASGTLTPDEAAKVNAAFAAEIEKLRSIGTQPPVVAAPERDDPPAPAPASAAAPVELTPDQAVSAPTGEPAPAEVVAAPAEAAPVEAAPAAVSSEPQP